MCTICQPTAPYGDSCAYRSLPQMPEADAELPSMAAMAAAAGPLPSAEYSEIADYLVSGYWEDQGTGPRAFDVPVGGEITVNYASLTPEAQVLARAALDAWEDATGLVFVEGSAFTADILFDDSDRFSAFASSTLRGDTILNSFVNVGRNWNFNDTSVDGYTFQTYIHEIGHALGLGHAGNYNGVGDFSSDATFAFDSWQASVMSYFAQDENPNIDASFAYTITAMPSDIEAIRALYGTAGTTRTENTTYWNNSTAGGVLDDLPFYDQPVTATIVDDGGIDTLDFSGESVDQEIHAYGGGVSSVGGLRGNLIIYYDTDIENVIGGSGRDNITGGRIANEFSGGGGADTLDLRDGDDTGRGEAGDDTIYGGDGNDRLEGGSGNDSMFGGNGVDTVVFTISTAVTVSLRTSAAQDTGEGIDTIRQIENAETAGGNDSLTGNADANILYSGAGDDRLDGGAGRDTLRGDQGNDILFGREGDDTLEAGADDDNVFGADGDDLLFGGSGDDMLQGGFGNDLIEGGNGRDIALFKKPGGNATVDLAITGAQDTGYGIDTLSSIEVLISGEGDDTLLGDSGDNNLQARDGDDSVSGRGGNDKLFGGAGNDVIDGGAGDDRLHGRADNDVLTGGGGADIFVFETFDDDDIITDFTDGEDLIRIRNDGAFDASGLAIFDLGTDTLIAFGDVTITLRGVDASLIGAEDFDFV